MKTISRSMTDEIIERERDKKLELNSSTSQSQVDLLENGINTRDILKDDMCSTDNDNGTSGGWTFRVVPNDIQKFSGDCLFMALAQFLLPDSDPNDALQSHAIIRHSIVNFLTRNESTWRRYSIWLKNNHQARIKEFRNYLPDSTCSVLHNKIQKAYKKHMMTAGYFGTMAELDAAMELFGFRTTLIQEDPSEKQFSVYNIGDVDWEHHMYLLFTGHSDGGHFQKLILLSDEEEVPAGKFQITCSSRENFTVTLEQVKPNSNELPELAEQRSDSENNKKRIMEDKSEEDISKRSKNDSPCDKNSLLGSEANSDAISSLTKIELCQLRSLFTADLSNTNTETGTAREGSEGDSAVADTTLTEIQAIPEIKDSSIYYVYLPPWTWTVLQKAAEDIVGEVKEKAFVLLDCRNMQCERRTLSLKKHRFTIESEDLYKIKNFTDKGVFVKFMQT